MECISKINQIICSSASCSRMQKRIEEWKFMVQNLFIWIPSIFRKEKFLKFMSPFECFKSISTGKFIGPTIRIMVIYSSGEKCFKICSHKSDQEKFLFGVYSDKVSVCRVWQLFGLRICECICWKFKWTLVARLQSNSLMGFVVSSQSNDCYHSISISITDRMAICRWTFHFSGFIWSQFVKSADMTSNNSWLLSHGELIEWIERWWENAVGRTNDIQLMKLI